jgi:hypothetical protein
MPTWTKNSASALRWLKPLGLMLMLLPLASCTTLGRGISVVDTSCKAFRPITYSKTDTPETVTEVRAHNRVYDRLCPPEKGTP